MTEYKKNIFFKSDINEMRATVQLKSKIPTRKTKI